MCQANECNDKCFQSDRRVHGIYVDTIFVWFHIVHTVAFTISSFTRTPVRVSKRNAVVGAQLAFEMLTLHLKNIYTARASVQKYWTAKVWPW